MVEGPGFRVGRIKHERIVSALSWEGCNQVDMGKRRACGGKAPLGSGFHMQTLTIYKLGFNRIYYTFPLIGQFAPDQRLRWP